MSLPSRGAWIEILLTSQDVCEALSLPSRGAWIEIAIQEAERVGTLSIPSRGAWIEIFVVRAPDAAKTCRSLDGERGLKCRCRSTCKPKRMSLPSRG